MAGSFDSSFNTNSNAGNREQLLDLTTVLSPRQAPIYGLLPKSKATADLVEWTVDDLADPADNAVVEGTDLTFGTGGSDADAQKFSKLARLDNRLQHFRKTFMVTKKQEVLDSVTPVKLQQAEEKATSELLRDIEKAICSDQGAVAGTSSTAGKLRGLGRWISNAGGASGSAGGTGNDGATIVPADFRTPLASIHGASHNNTSNANVDGVTTGDLSENDFAKILASIFNETGEMQDLHLVADTALRNHIVDEFTRTNGSASQVRYNQDSGAVVEYNVEMFNGPFGVVKILTANPKCMPGTLNDRGYLIDPSLLGWAEALPTGSTMLEDQGGGPRGYIDAMGTLICRGPKGLGKIGEIA
tara:strand:- start:282 stop:1355 length:1074 start_codon:yes stop_codon:yes gene_type:complete